MSVDYGVQRLVKTYSQYDNRSVPMGNWGNAFDEDIEALDPETSELPNSGAWASALYDDERNSAGEILPQEATSELPNLSIASTSSAGIVSVNSDWKSRLPLIIGVAAVAYFLFRRCLEKST